MSEHARRKAADFFRRRVTDARLHLPALLRVIALVVGVIVLLCFSPHVATRADANGLNTVFAGLLTALLAILGGYVIARKNKLVDRPALVIAALGLFAMIAGLVDLPLDSYRWALAISIAAVVHGSLTLIAAAST